MCRVFCENALNFKHHLSAAVFNVQLSHNQKSVHGFSSFFSTKTCLLFAFITMNDSFSTDTLSTDYAIVELGSCSTTINIPSDVCSSDFQPCLASRIYSRKSQASMKFLLVNKDLGLLWLIIKYAVINNFVSFVNNFVSILYLFI